jgi:hypothetical protein
MKSEVNFLFSLISDILSLDTLTRHALGFCCFLDKFIKIFFKG